MENLNDRLLGIVMFCAIWQLVLAIMSISPRIYAKAVNWVVTACSRYNDEIPGVVSFYLFVMFVFVLLSILFCWCGITELAIVFGVSAIPWAVGVAAMTLVR